MTQSERALLASDIIRLRPSLTTNALLPFGRTAGVRKTACGVSVSF